MNSSYATQSCFGTERDTLGKRLDGLGIDISTSPIVHQATEW